MQPLSLVLPCYNEAPGLPALVARAVESARARGRTPADFRLILVQNGSTDDTPAVLADILKTPDGAFVDGVDVPVNRGYGHGLLQGLRAVRTPLAAFSHGDGQCDPDDALRAADVLADLPAPALVKGRRHGRALGERAFSAAFALLGRVILGRRLHEINAQPKVFPRELIDRLEAAPTDFTFDLFVLLTALEAGYALHEIDVAFPPRRHGQSNWARGLRARIRTSARFVRFMSAYRRGKHA